jgi:hypothetical protein
MDEAEQSFLKVSDPEAKAQRLMRLAGNHIGPRRQSLLDQALRLLNDKVDAQERITVLTAAAAYLDGIAKDFVLETARQQVPSLPERFAQARSLIAIGEAWSGKKLRAPVLEASAIPGGILAIGLPQKDSVERVEFLAALCADPSERDIVRNEAMGQLNVVTKPYERARILASLLPILERDESARTVKEVRSYIETSDDSSQRAELLTRLLPYVPTDDKAHLLTEALTFARSIVPGETKVTGTFNFRTEVVAIDPVSDIMGRPALAILRIGMMVDAPQRDELICEGAGCHARFARCLAGRGHRRDHAAFVWDAGSSDACC